MAHRLEGVGEEVVDGRGDHSIEALKPEHLAQAGELLPAEGVVALDHVGENRREDEDEDVAADNHHREPRLRYSGEGGVREVWE